MALATAAEFARRHAEDIINGRNLDLVDEVYAQDAVFNDPVAPGGVARGREEIKAFFSAVVQAMPDFHFTIEDTFGTEDRGIWRGTLSATLQGAFGPIPATGKSATVPIAEVFRVTGGQIAEVWVYFDTLSAMQQFGIIPAPDAGNG
jgi:steroid delta-isomerase-like uncharacterized protein